MVGTVLALGCACRVAEMDVKMADDIGLCSGLALVRCLAWVLWWQQRWFELVRSASLGFSISGGLSAIAVVGVWAVMMVACFGGFGGLRLRVTLPGCLAASNICHCKGP